MDAARPFVTNTAMIFCCRPAEPAQYGRSQLKPCFPDQVRVIASQAVVQAWQRKRARRTTIGWASRSNLPISTVSLRNSNIVETGLGAFVFSLEGTTRPTITNK